MLPPPKIPPFPSTPALLAPFTQRTGTVPRYYHASTLLMFALSKQWKSRYFVLTAPLAAPAASISPTGNGAAAGLAPSYLHVFKSAGADEKELERLEINEESVAYVADGEVGGRKSVVKFEGILRRRPSHSSMNVSTNAEEPAGGEEGRTAWIVQIQDAEDAQKWIEAVKGAVLNQRCVAFVNEIVTSF